MQTHATLAGGLVVSSGVLFAIGVGLIVTGTYLHWQLSHYLMRAEEDAKDGRLSEEQARRRIALFRYSGPVMILLGASAFGVVLMS